MGFNETPDFQSRIKKAQGPNKKEKMSPITSHLPCTFEEIFSGSKKKIKITRSRYCNTSNVMKDEIKILSLKIKPWWKEGTRIIFHGEGDDTQENLPGDIVFILKELKHKHFRRNGDDLVFVANISLIEALTDCILKIPTIDKRTLLLACPEVMSPNYERIIQSEGMPKKNEMERGNLVIKFSITFPKTINKHKKSQLRNLLQN